MVMGRNKIQTDEQFGYNNEAKRHPTPPSFPTPLSPAPPEKRQRRIHTAPVISRSPSPEMAFLPQAIRTSSLSGRKLYRQVCSAPRSRQQQREVIRFPTLSLKPVMLFVLIPLSYQGEPKLIPFITEISYFFTARRARHDTSVPRRSGTWISRPAVGKTKAGKGYHCASG